MLIVCLPFVESSSLRGLRKSVRDCLLGELGKEGWILGQPIVPLFRLKYLLLYLYNL